MKETTTKKETKIKGKLRISNLQRQPREERKVLTGCKLISIFSSNEILINGPTRSSWPDSVSFAVRS